MTLRFTGAAFSEGVCVFDLSTPLNITALMRFATVVNEENIRIKAVILNIGNLERIALLSPAPVLCAISALKKRKVFVGWIKQNRVANQIYDKFYSSFKHLVEEFSSLSSAQQNFLERFNAQQT